MPSSAGPCILRASLWSSLMISCSWSPSPPTISYSLELQPDPFSPSTNTDYGSKNILLELSNKFLLKLISEKPFRIFNMRRWKTLKRNKRKGKKNAWELMKLNKFSSIFRVYFSWSTEEQSGKDLERKVLQTTASIKNTGGGRLEQIEILSMAISYVQIHAFRKLGEKKTVKLMGLIRHFSQRRNFISDNILHILVYNKAA